MKSEAKVEIKNSIIKIYEGSFIASGVVSSISFVIIRRIIKMKGIIKLKVNAW